MVLLYSGGDFIYSITSTRSDVIMTPIYIYGIIVFIHDVENSNVTERKKQSASGGSLICILRIQGFKNISDKESEKIIIIRTRLSNGLLSFAYKPAVSFLG